MLVSVLALAANPPLGLMPNSRLDIAWRSVGQQPMTDAEFLLLSIVCTWLLGWMLGFYFLALSQKPAHR